MQMNELEQGGREVVSRREWSSAGPRLVAPLPPEAKQVDRADVFNAAPKNDWAQAPEVTPPLSGALSVTNLDPVLDRIAQSRLSVVITGETGAGKDVLARKLHERSPRARKPFVAINCAAVCGSLLESELFGHERGSFTGAAAARMGLVEAAEGGTLFLDEVAELSASAQAKLLRVLENRTVTRVGGVTTRVVDVRFIAATNRDLERAVAAGEFREDLRFRLEGIQLYVPPLRTRRGEILPAARTFLREQAARDGLAPATLTADAEAALLRHTWEGNFRELRNAVERAAIICRNGEIAAEDLMLAPATGTSSVHTTVRTREVAVATPPELPADPLDAQAMRDQIIAALTKCAGNQTRAAKMLGISRRTLITRLERYGVPRPHARRLRAVAG